MNPLMQIYMAFQAVIVAVIEFLKSVGDLTFGNLFVGNQLNTAKQASSDDQYEAANKEDGTDIDNPGEGYTKSSTAGYSNKEEEDEDSSSGDDTVVNSDFWEDISEDSINGDTENLDGNEGQVRVDDQQEWDDSGDETTNVNTFEEIETAEDSPTQSDDEPRERSGEKIDYSPEHVEAYVKNVIASAHEIVVDKPGTEDISQTDRYPNYPVEDVGVNDQTAEIPADVKKLVSDDFDTNIMGEGASKLEPHNLAEHPLIPADISDLTAGEAQGPTGDKIIIIDYKKRRNDQEATNDPSSGEAEEESDCINGRQNDSLASDPGQSSNDESQNSINDECTSFEQIEQLPLSLERNPEEDRRAAKTELVSDGSLASHPYDLAVHKDEEPPSLTKVDKSSDNELKTQNIEGTHLCQPQNIKASTTLVEDSEFTPVVTENDRTANLKDEASDKMENGKDHGDERRNSDNEIKRVLEKVASQDIQQIEESLAAENLIGLPNVGIDNIPVKQEGNVVNDSIDMSEDDDNPNKDSTNELELLGGEIPSTNTDDGVPEDCSFTKVHDHAKEEEEIEDLPAQGIRDDGDYRSTDHTNEKGELKKADEEVYLPITATFEQSSFAGNFDTGQEINGGTDVPNKIHVATGDMKSDDDTSEQGKPLGLVSDDDKSMTEFTQDDSDERSLNDAFGEGGESKKEFETEELLIFTPGDETLTENSKSEDDSGEMHEDDDKQSAEHKDEHDVLSGDITFTNTEAYGAESDSFTKSDDHDEKQEESEGSLGETVTEDDGNDIQDDNPAKLEETWTGNYDDAAGDEFSGNSNDIYDIGTQERTSPVSFTGDESKEKADSVGYPVGVTEDRTDNNEMSLCEAIAANNVYLSKPTNDGEFQHDANPVADISGDVEPHGGKNDNEAVVVAYERVVTSDDDSIVSDNIASDTEDIIESEKLAKGLEEKRIEELCTNPEREKSPEDLVSNEGKPNENDDQWEATGSESTSTTPSIDYQGVLEDDDNKLRSKPYDKNDVDDSLIEETVTFQENVSLESSDFKNLLNQLNGDSNESSNDSSPRKTYTDEEVRRAIQILTSRPPYDTKDVDYEDFYKGMSRAETLRVFALVLAPNQPEGKERVFGIFSNPEDISYDNRYIGDEKDIAPTLKENSFNMSDLFAVLEQPMSAGTSEDIETYPEPQAEESLNFDSQKHHSEDDETESSSSASSGMYIVNDNPDIFDDERSQLVIVKEHESIPVSEVDNDNQESDIPLHGGKFFCVTKTFAKPDDNRDPISNIAPIKSFSDVPPNVGRPLPTHKSPLEWIVPEENKDVRLSLTKDNHQISDKVTNVETETRILHLTEDFVEFDMYLYHQPTESDVGSANQEDDVKDNVFQSPDSREVVENLPEPEESILPTIYDGKPSFRPYNMGDGEWEAVDSPRKIYNVKEFDFNPAELKHMTFEEDVVPFEDGPTNIHENDIVPNVLEPYESSQINFNFAEGPEVFDTTDPSILETPLSAPENHVRGTQQCLDDTTNMCKASDDSHEEGNHSGYVNIATYNVNLEHYSMMDTDNGPGSKREDDKIVPTTHDTKLAFQPQDMGDGEWEKVDISRENNYSKNINFYPTQVEHRSFQENVLPIDHGSETVKENDIVPEVLEPVDSFQINFDFHEVPESRVITEPPVLVTKVKFKSQESNDLVDKSQLLEDISDILDNDGFEEDDETESMESNPPHFRDEDEPLLERVGENITWKNETPNSISDLLRDVGITDDDEILGGSAFVVVGTPSDYVRGDIMKATDVEVDKTLPPQNDDNSVAGLEKSSQIPCDVKTHGNHYRSSSSSTLSSSSSEKNGSSDKDEFPYESLDNDVDSCSKGGDSINDAGYIQSLTLPLEQLSSSFPSTSSSSSNDEDDAVDVGLNHSERRDSGRRSSSSSSCSSNNTAQEPDVSERVDTVPAPEEHGLLADNHDLTSEEAAEYGSFNYTIDGPTDVTVIGIDKGNDILDETLDDSPIQTLPFEDKLHPAVTDGSNESDFAIDDHYNPITDTADVTMDVYLETSPLVSDTALSNDCQHDNKSEEDNSIQIPENEEDFTSPVSFNMYLDTAPLEESPIEIDTYLEHVAKSECGAAHLRAVSTSDSDDVTPPRGRVESSSAASSFSDSDVSEEPASNRPSIIFAVYGKAPETDKDDEKPMVVAIHQTKRSLSFPNLHEDDERPYEFQGSVEVFREEEFGEIHKRSVSSFVEISRSRTQPIDQWNSAPGLDVRNDGHV